MPQNESYMAVIHVLVVNQIGLIVNSSEYFTKWPKLTQYNYKLSVGSHLTESYWIYKQLGIMHFQHINNQHSV